MKKKAIVNLATFAEACKKLSSDEIYTLYEDKLEKHLRLEIINLADTASPEPVRAALNTIGRHYKVDSLINY
jgi:hypothetical protein